MIHLLEIMDLFVIMIYATTVPNSFFHSPHFNLRRKILVQVAITNVMYNYISNFPLAEKEGEDNELFLYRISNS